MNRAETQRHMAIPDVHGGPVLRPPDVGGPVRHVVNVVGMAEGIRDTVEGQVPLPD
jgi:hypothetical protein